MANILQLSPATVSRALSGNKIVNKNTLNKITDLANKMGYQPNNFASKNLMISDLSEAASIEISQSIIKMKHRPDGIFMSSDPSAAICMRNLKDAGINKPEEIAIIGFNNDIISRVVEPGLTTVNYPGQKMGEIAVIELIK